MSGRHDLFSGLRGGYIPRGANDRCLVLTRGNAVLFGVPGADLSSKNCGKSEKGILGVLRIGEKRRFLGNLGAKEQS